MRLSSRILSAGVVAAAAFLLMSFTGCRETDQERNRYTATFLDAFDTVTEITGYADNEEAFTRQVELLQEKLMYYHRLYDIYNSYEDFNNMKTINDHAGTAPVEVSRDILDLLIYSSKLYDYTDGRMNIAMGSVLSVWHTYREAGIDDPGGAELPPMETLMAAAEHMDIGQMVIDQEASTVYLADKEMSLDVGGIGKGYAAQKTAEYAREIGMEHVIISVGGNICAVGGKPEGGGWRLGVQNPDLTSDKKYVATVEVADASVVTSGDYQRYYMVDGKRYGHIIDPSTRMPADYFSAVTIIAENSALADGLTTAVYNMPLEEGMAFVNGLEGVEAMWILKDGRIRYSEGFEGYLVE